MPTDMRLSICNPAVHGGSMKAWYSLLTTLLETKTMIYGGNNFEV